MTDFPTRELAEHRLRTKVRTRKQVNNMIDRLGLRSRVKLLNEGTFEFDEKFIYYCQKKKARVSERGRGMKFYQMRGFQHFVDVFLSEDKTDDSK